MVRAKAPLAHPPPYLFHTSNLEKARGFKYSGFWSGRYSGIVGQGPGAVVAGKFLADFFLIKLEKYDLKWLFKDVLTKIMAV